MSAETKTESLAPEELAWIATGLEELFRAAPMICKAILGEVYMWRRPMIALGSGVYEPTAATAGEILMRLLTIQDYQFYLYESGPAWDVPTSRLRAYGPPVPPLDRQKPPTSARLIAHILGRLDSAATQALIRGVTVHSDVCRAAAAWLDEWSVMDLEAFEETPATPFKPRKCRQRAARALLDTGPWASRSRGPVTLFSLFQALPLADLTDFAELRLHWGGRGFDIVKGSLRRV